MATRGSLPVLLGLALCLACAPATVARADEEAAPPLEPRNFELLPLSDLERKELARDHPEAAARITLLAGRLGKLREHLAGRKDPADDGGRKLAAQIASVEAQLAPFMAQLVEATRAMDVTPALLRHIREAPDGPHRVARYAQGIPLWADGVPDAARALLARVVPRIEGALFYLDADRRIAQEEHDRAKRDGNEEQVAFLRDRLARNDRRVREMEKRYWRLVDYVVPQAPKAAIHRALPTAYQQLENVFGHLYALPGLTAAQAVRLRALLVEIEAEASPDAALAKRVRAALRSAKGAERAALERELAESGNRVTALHRYATDLAKEILTADQWEALEAIPPRVSPGDRQQTSPRILAGLTLDVTQRERLAAMRAGLAEVREDIRRKRIAAAAMGAPYGPDSPQMMSMQMAMASVQAEGSRIQRAFNGRLFLELLTPAQVTQWVLGVDARR